jgi:hypothetical protein
MLPSLGLRLKHLRPLLGMRRHSRRNQCSIAAANQAHSRHLFDYGSGLSHLLDRTFLGVRPISASPLATSALHVRVGAHHSKQALQNSTTESNMLDWLVDTSSAAGSGCGVAGDDAIAYNCPYGGPGHSIAKRAIQGFGGPVGRRNTPAYTAPHRRRAMDGALRVPARGPGYGPSRSQVSRRCAADPASREQPHSLCHRGRRGLRAPLALYLDCMDPARLQEGSRGLLDRPTNDPDGPPSDASWAPIPSRSPLQRQHPGLPQAESPGIDRQTTPPIAVAISVTSQNRLIAPSSMRGSVTQ